MTVLAKKRSALFVVATVFVAIAVVRYMKSPSQKVLMYCIYGVVFTLPYIEQVINYKLELPMRALYSKMYQATDENRRVRLQILLFGLLYFLPGLWFLLAAH